MPPLETILLGFSDAFTLTNLLFVICGVAIGQMVGAIPGIGPVMALYASLTGDTFSDIVLILLAATIALLALKVGPVEVCALILVAFSIIAGLIGGSMIKGLIAAVMGLLVATVGIGIPGSISAALLISVFKIHGIQPGPLLFETQARLIYGLFGVAVMLIAETLSYVMGVFGFPVVVSIIAFFLGNRFESL